MFDENGNLEYSHGMATATSLAVRNITSEFLRENL